ncbi:MAG: HU domain-containing protein [Clostridiales bacterium]|nr:HU domain-containing protein [Clostridiales bacterium]
MAVKLRKIQRKNPQDQTQAKWYLVQAKSGSVGMHRIVKDIQGRSAMTAGDVKNVLTNLAELLPVYLQLGQSVNLDGFGTFRISVSSVGMEKAEELTTRHAKEPKITFLPSKELKQGLLNISYEIVP